MSEISKAGVAMAADSMISYIDATGNIIRQKHWKKLFKVDLKGTFAGVSYWGDVGYITDENFDVWLSKRLTEAPRSDLRSLASYLAEQANLAAGDKLIAKQKSAGLHVAGFHAWSDGQSRPTFFHIHNGHITAEATTHPLNGDGDSSGGIASYSIPTGLKNEALALKSFLQAAKEQGSKVDYRHYVGGRKPFEVHADFPSESATLAANLAELETGHLTRNGDHLTDALVEAGLEEATAARTDFPITGLPEPSEKLGARLGVLIERMKIVVRKYACHSVTPIVGGPISVLAICEDGTHFDGCGWMKTASA